MGAKSTHGGKGKTMGDPRHLANCARSWARGEVRKNINRAANEARAAANRLLRAEGLPTPHEAQKAKRKALRDQRRQAGVLAPIGMTQAAFNKIPREGTK
jgi:hypothetical protein